MLEGANNLSPKQESRRAFLRAVAGAGLLSPALLTSCASPRREDLFPKEAIGFERRGPYESPKTPVYSSQRFESNYLRELVASLQKERGNPNSRAEAVRDNLAGVIKSQMTGWLATALKIDESGYFLTAGHNFGALPDGINPATGPFFIYEPITNTPLAVKNFLIEPGNDAAVIFAPTQKPSKPLEKINLKLSDYSHGISLWMYSLASPNPQDVRMNILFGQVQNQNLPKLSQPYKALVIIEGMPDPGGEGGEPIIDEGGFVVGVRTLTVTLPNSQIRTVFTPMKNLQDLVDSPRARLFNLPYQDSY
jgi:hypothetical protein